MATFLLACSLLFQNTLVNQAAKAPKTLKLTKLYTLGQDEEVFLGTSVNMVQAEDGTLIVTDPTNHRLLYFDKDGKFEKELLRKGQGPGEFDEPVLLEWDNEGRLAVFDTGHRRVIFLDKEGNHLADKKMETNIQAVLFAAFLDGEGVAMSTFKTLNDGSIAYDISLYDAELKHKKELLRVTLPPTDWSQMQNPNFWVGFLKDQFEAILNGMPFAVATPGGMVAVGRANKYKVAFYDSKGHPHGAMETEMDPQPLTEAEKMAYFEELWQNFTSNPFLSPNLTQPVFEKAAAQAEVPPFLPPVSFATTLGDGFLVLANYTRTKSQGELHYYNSKGELQSRGTYAGQGNGAYGKGNMLFTTGIDEDDNVIIEAYRVEF